MNFIVFNHGEEISQFISPKWPENVWMVSDGYNALNVFRVFVTTVLDQTVNNDFWNNFFL